jgi:FkbM family methyltransferase
MGIRTLVGDTLRRFGYQAVPHDQLESIGLGLHLKRLLLTQHIDVVLDVGANRGQYRRFLREFVEFPGTILSFEPVPKLHRRLTRAAEDDPHWHIFPFALGARAETTSLNIMRADDLSSFLEPDTSHTDRFRDSNTTVEEARVEVRRLRDIFPKLRERFGLKRPYLKMDTQGFDLKVIEGAGSVLSEIVALQTEASVLPLYEGMPRYGETIEHLEGRGFELSGVWPITTDESMRLIEFDCVMVNPSRIDPLDVERR